MLSFLFSTVALRMITCPPPLARGTARLPLALLLIARITPACAGNRTATLTTRGTPRDHPRLRGEQSTLCTKQAVTLGSPPLARGTAPFSPFSPFAPGITPACAGNRQCDNLLHTCGWDHPRLRGEQTTAANPKSIIRGSPPLARGTADMLGRECYVGRITPACAGNSKADEEQKHRAKDHPRLRGEQSCFFVNSPTILGSPPLARGTERVRWRKGNYKGITPACAGNSHTIPHECDLM